MPPRFFLPTALANAVRRRILFIWLVLATVALLCPLPEAWHSLEQKSPLPLDKLAHFGGTAFSLLLAHWRGWRLGRNALFWVAYSGAIELIQGATGFRTGDMLDFLAASAGVVAGAAGVLAAGGVVADRK